MREIKFRVWNIDEYISLNKAIHDDIVVIQQPSSSNDSLIEINWEGVELEQFTGMHDKNGVPIYEGDIVSGYVHFPEVNYIVCYNSSDYSCGFKCKQSDGAGVIDVWYKGLTVIGNIHQHAHLLEQDK